MISHASMQHGNRKFDSTGRDTSSNAADVTRMYIGGVGYGFVSIQRYSR